MTYDFGSPLRVSPYGPVWYIRHASDKQRITLKVSARKFMVKHSRISQT